MNYESLTVLIPSHSLEDLPLELPEGQAEGLLNAFAVLWHPVLIGAAGLLPRWERADDPPVLSANSLVIVPAVSRDWLACQWLDNVSDTGANVISDVDGRTELLERCLAPLEVPATLDADLASDFLALGHCYLQVELLTRQMRYFSELDEARMESSVLSAARAALAGDGTAARSHLGDCFEMLLESRERFYPVDCYLIDLCLLTVETADENWAQLATSERVLNYLATAADLQELAAKHPEAMAGINQRWRDGKQEFVGGELTEGPVPLVPLDVTLQQFLAGLREFEQRFDRRPVVWGRRRFGIGPQLPQLLDKLDFSAALHFVMDDGLYPDEEQGKLRWEGCDGTSIDATSRIPLAGDAATSFLRFPLRMSESMDYDHAAIVQFARWPQLHSPWLDDFHRIHKYAPVLGKFVTFSEFFRSTDAPGRLTKFKAADYLSPYLLQSVAREERAPISRYADCWGRQHRFEEWTWLSAVRDLVAGQSVRLDDAEDKLLNVAPANSDATPEPDSPTFLEEQCATARQQLAAAIAGGRGQSTGCLVLNCCSFTRRVIVDWPPALSEPARCDAIVARQWNDSQRSLVVAVPPSGFVWLPCAAPEASMQVPRPPKVPLAEEGVLRNEFFEVGISDQTGGIAHLKTYGRGPNRLSQQLAFRFRHERVQRVQDGDDFEERRTFYSQMRCTAAKIVSAGPGIGEIETRGTLIDPQADELLGEYRQRVRVRRGRPLVEIDLEIEVHKEPEGDPWSSYFACRWAWNDPEAALTASVHEGAQPVGAERFEAPHYIEIAGDDLRTTILPHGLPFHRKAGARMLDTLLIVAGEARRRFRFVIAVDEAYPMERARDCMIPIVPAVVEAGPEQTFSGWIFHLDALNVQITRLLPLMPWPRSAETIEPARLGVGLRLRETEGRHRTVRLRCFRTPSAARQRDFLGKTISELTLDADAVVVEVTAFEICDVEVMFA